QKDLRAWLIFLGGTDEVRGEHRLIEPASLTSGGMLQLDLRHRERWRRQDVTRVIVGSDPTWADLVLVDEPLTIVREHARFYLNHRAPDASDFRPTKGGAAVINGRTLPSGQWVNVHSGDEIQMSCWRF